MDRVTYKPLEMSAQNGIYLNDNIGGEEEDDDDELEDELFNSMKERNSHLPYFHSIFSNHFRYNQFNLRHLRVTLYVVAILLFFLFIAQLSSNERNIKLSNTSSSSDDRPDNSKSPLPNTVVYFPLKVAAFNNPVNQRPQYETYLSSVLSERNKNKSSEPFDDLHFPQESLSTLQPSTSIWWLLNLRDNAKYITVTNYIRAMKSFNYNTSITLTTQATTEFMYHTLELCKRWDGPISVAVFSPGIEMVVATTLIKFMRQCLPSPLSACIRDKVTWHLVYNKLYGPQPSAISYPKNHLDGANFPLFVNQNQCPKLAGPEPTDLIKQFEEKLRKVNGISQTSYRHINQLPYPINVLRNTARLAASTKYLLASDIELYPSINLVSKFTNYIRKHDVKQEYNYINKFDFTLPIFEVKSNVSAPKTKKELIKLVYQGDAIFFHKWVCDACQNFPNRLDWLQTNTYGVQDDIEDSDEIKIFEITQRNKTRDSWEPIFIGTNDDPLYDDRLTWDGRRDKMAQMYEMCLQDYYHLVIGNAFLVHAPGIKHIDKKDTMKRLKFIRENNAIYDETISSLRRQYSKSRNIDSC